MAKAKGQRGYMPKVLKSLAEAEAEFLALAKNPPASTLYLEVAEAPDGTKYFGVPYHKHHFAKAICDALGWKFYGPSDGNGNGVRTVEIVKEVKTVPTPAENAAEFMGRLSGLPDKGLGIVNTLPETTDRQRAEKAACYGILFPQGKPVPLTGLDGPEKNGTPANGNGNVIVEGDEDDVASDETPVDPTAAKVS
jgi:hypothetical protein